MKYLAIDTSSKNLIVIAKNEDKCYVHYDPECGVNHSVSLMPAVEEALDKCDLNLKDVDFLACTVGAGSFTGIRIGISTIKALCFAYNKPCLSLTSFDLVAYNKNGEKIMAIIDAKHSHYYACGYDKNQVTVSPCYIDTETLNEYSKEYLLASSETIDSVKTEVLDPVTGMINAIEKKKGEVFTDLEKLCPEYVRKSQAEEGR